MKSVIFPHTLDLDCRFHASMATGGAGNGSDCAVDFQSPGPFGAVTTITVP
jgi:hypothetical protein